MVLFKLIKLIKINSITNGKKNFQVYEYETFINISIIFHTSIIIFQAYKKYIYQTSPSLYSKYISNISYNKKTFKDINNIYQISIKWCKMVE